MHMLTQKRLACAHINLHMVVIQTAKSFSQVPYLLVLELLQRAAHGTYVLERDVTARRVSEAAQPAAAPRSTPDLLKMDPRD